MFQKRRSQESRFCFDEENRLVLLSVYFSITCFQNDQCAWFVLPTKLKDTVYACVCIMFVCIWGACVRTLHLGYTHVSVHLDN